MGFSIGTYPSPMTINQYANFQTPVEYYASVNNTTTTLATVAAGKVIYITDFVANNITDAVQLIKIYRDATVIFQAYLAKYSLAQPSLYIRFSSPLKYSAGEAIKVSSASSTTAFTLTGYEVDE